MSNTDNFTADSATTTHTGASESQIKQDSNELKKTMKAHKRRKFVVIGCILVLAGWLLMMLQPTVSLCATFLGLISSIIGVRIPPGPRRNFAITAIIAASVLLLVYAIFAFILYVAI